MLENFRFSLTHKTISGVGRCSEYLNQYPIYKIRITIAHLPYFDGNKTKECRIKLCLYVQIWVSFVFFFFFFHEKEKNDKKTKKCEARFYSNFADLTNVFKLHRRGFKLNFFSFISISIYKLSFHELRYCHPKLYRDAN